MTYLTKTISQRLASRRHFSPWCFHEAAEACLFAPVCMEAPWKQWYWFDHFEIGQCNLSIVWSVCHACDTFHLPLGRGQNGLPAEGWAKHPDRIPELLSSGVAWGRLFVVWCVRGFRNCSSAHDSEAWQWSAKPWKHPPDLEGSNSLSELGIVGLDGLPKFGPIHLASFDFLSRWDPKKTCWAYGLYCEDAWNLHPSLREPENLPVGGCRSDIAACTRSGSQLGPFQLWPLEVC